MLVSPTWERLKDNFWLLSEAEWLGGVFAAAFFIKLLMFRSHAAKRARSFAPAILAFSALPFISLTADIAETGHRSGVLGLAMVLFFMLIFYFIFHLPLLALLFPLAAQYVHVRSGRRTVDDRTQWAVVGGAYIADALWGSMTVMPS